MFFSTAQERLALARQRFFDEGQRPTGLVSEAVIQSWARCVNAKRDPAEPVAFEPVTASRVHSSLGRCRELLGAASSPLGELDIALSGSACWALLTDKTGVVVHVGRRNLSGNEHIMPTLGRLGVNVAEGVVGTNAPGIVIKSGRVCTVLGGEHFFESIKPMYCAAAPLRDAQREVVAVLNLSQEGRPFGFDAESLVAQYAVAIENRLMLAKAKDQMVLHFHTSSALLGSQYEALAGVSPDGRVVWANDLATRCVGCSTGGLEALFGMSLTDLTRMLGQSAPVLLRLTNGLTVWSHVTLHAQDGAKALVAMGGLHREEPTPLAVPEQTQAPAAPAVTEAQTHTTLGVLSQQHIEKTLAASGGNVSLAARKLGVSRGLIYRYLRGIGTHSGRKD